MSTTDKKDMLGPIIRALVGVPEKDLGILLDITNKIGGKDGEQWRARFAEDLRKGIMAVKTDGTHHLKLFIDRTVPFNPVKFIGSGWSIIEEDKSSLALTEIDFGKVSFETCLKFGEKYITGEEKLLRHAKAGHILADAKIGQTLFEEEGQKTLEYLYKEKGITWFELQGTVLRHPDGDRYALYLCRDDDGRWGWGCGWLGSYRGSANPSVVLAST